MLCIIGTHAVPLPAASPVVADPTLPHPTHPGPCPLCLPDISSTNAAYEEMQQQNTALLAHLTQRDTAITDLQTAKQVVQQQLEAVQQQLKESQAQLAGLQGEHRELQVVREALEKDLVKAQADLTLVRR